MPYAHPPFRTLRAYAFDPSLPLTLDKAIDNQLTLKVPWEDDLRPGPIGEYVEVIDFDSANECFYAPVDLNATWLLAQDGLSPAEGVPQFHQQAVYALVMSTIRHFERGLGRPVQWSARPTEYDGEPTEEFVRRLRVYPHALSAPQAFYSPSRKALLLGYFSVESTAVTGAPTQTTAFACLSPATVAHETAHAILDGLHRAVDVDESGMDALAVQEAVADLVALFQQFALAGFLRHHVPFTGDLDENQKRLAAMARHLAQPLGVQAHLRDAIGVTASMRAPASPGLKFHERGAVLVAAVFDAFAAVWRRRCARLLGPAVSEGAGWRLLGGDVQDEVANEAARIASHMLRMCIRALDYCPPVDVTIANYLRALITADTEICPEDPRKYRVALVEAFRRAGIYSSAPVARSPLQLLWRPMASRLLLGEKLKLDEAPASSRAQEFEREVRRREMLRAAWFRGTRPVVTPDAAREMGLTLDKHAPRTVARGDDGLPMVSVDSFRLARRVGPDARIVTDWVVTITQARRGYFDAAVQEAEDAKEEQKNTADFMFRGGCTLLIDAATGQVRFCLAKDILAGDRLARHREWSQQRLTFAGGIVSPVEAGEPFAALRAASLAAV